MLQQTIFKSVVITTLVCLSSLVFAESDSTKIGIKVEIKAKQVCDYAYTFEGNENPKLSREIGFFTCDKSPIKLQQEANKIATSKFGMSYSTMTDEHVRMFMVVQ